MRDFNKVIIMGNLTRDPEVKTIPSGQTVATFGVATNRRWTSSAGDQQEETEFHETVAWGKLAEICEQILFKGRKVLVEGRLKTRNWEGQDGIKRYKTEIVAENIAAVGPGRPTEGYGPQEEHESASSEATRTPAKDINEDIIETQKSPKKSFGLTEQAKVKSQKTEPEDKEETKTEKKPEKKDSSEKDLDDILSDMPF